MFKYLIVLSAALISSIFFIGLLEKISLKRKILKINNIPLVGGIGAGLAFIFSLSLGIFIFGLGLSKILIIAAVSLFMLFIGVIDDLKELSVMQKLLTQSLCAALLILSGIRTEIMYFGFWANAAITYFWILGMINAFNLLDIMDGLAAGVVFIISSAFVLMGYLSADLNVLLLSLILCAISFGFLIFNLPPAKVYLGNSGSHFFGLLVICIALITQYATENNVFALLSPLMILGLPIIDTALLIIFRIIKKKPFFKKSRDHLALKINAFGLTPLKTILIMYALCFVFVFCGVILTVVDKLSAAGIIIAVFLLSIGIFLRLIKIETNE